MRAIQRARAAASAYAALLNMGANVRPNEAGSAYPDVDAPHGPITGRDEAARLDALGAPRKIGGWLSMSLTERAQAIPHA